MILVLQSYGIITKNVANTVLTQRNAINYKSAHYV